jgi:hypothetical protein
VYAKLYAVENQAKQAGNKKGTPLGTFLGSSN